MPALGCPLNPHTLLGTRAHSFFWPVAGRDEAALGRLNPNKPFGRTHLPLMLNPDSTLVPLFLAVAAPATRKWRVLHICIPEDRLHGEAKVIIT